MLVMAIVHLPKLWSPTQMGSVRDKPVLAHVWI